jgi:hypothetical protein
MQTATSQALHPFRMGLCEWFGKAPDPDRTVGKEKPQTGKPKKISKSKAAQAA